MKIPARINFTRALRDWDGFGFNYVETAQTPDYATDPQEYGGFSSLSEKDRQTILDMVFGEDGLKPGVFKMFIDSFQQDEQHLNGPALGDLDLANYDHRTTTHWMRYCIKEGLRITRARGGDLRGVCTLYGPPAFMTKIKQIRGRDLDPAFELECAKYIVAFAKYMKEVEGLPIEYLSIHNEGEDFHRWPEDGLSNNLGTGHDYNLYWSPEHAASFIALLGDVAKAVDPALSPTPGECTGWTRFYHWGYAEALVENEAAMKALGLITSHGFYGDGIDKTFSNSHADTGIHALREQRPDLHAWVTSTSWSQMNAAFILEMYRNIYDAHVNAIIPWAGIQRVGGWVGGDPNPGCAFRVHDDGHYTVEMGYYYYKQISRAGQPGMKVVPTYVGFTPCALAAFSGEGTEHPNAFVAINAHTEPQELEIELVGGGSVYEAYRTSPVERYVTLGRVKTLENVLRVTLPADSVTTFYQVG
ncbi:hypothetical protein LJC74_03480 [Eubacteriales bacterium OttesenSCG-928-A19]|nr:hypothetical protein [Eubacteriales bacterium OttesenSCG-928-A19]